MPRSILAMTNTSSSLSSGTGSTHYAGLYGTASLTNTEAFRQMKMLRTGIVGNLFATITSNTIAATSTFTLRINAADGAQTISVGSNATGKFENIASGDSIAASDLIDVKFVPGAATGQLGVSIISALFQADSGTVISRRTTTCGADFIPSTTAYLTLESDYDDSDANGIGDTNENHTKLDMQTAGTFNNASVHVETNTITTSSTYTLRKNGANTAVTVSIPSSTSGYFDDTSNAVSVVVGDDVNHQFVSGSTGTIITVGKISIDFDSTDGVHGFTQMGNVTDATTDGGQTFARASTAYVSIDGGMKSVPTTESAMQMTTREAFSFSRLSCLVNANTNTSASTVQFRVNSADGTNSLSIAGSSSGYFTDSTPHTDSTSATDLVCIAVITGVGSGTQTTIFAYFSIVYATPVPSTDFYTFV